MVKVPLKGGLSLDVNVGDLCTVAGYDCGGHVRFAGKGLHEKQLGKWRVGVELSEPCGKNDGTIGGHQYFVCKAKHGVLVAPSKVTIVSRVDDEHMKVNPLFDDGDDSAADDPAGGPDSNAADVDIIAVDDGAAAVIEQERRKQEQDAATRIQASFRARMARKQVQTLREERAATRIQAAFRGSVARREVTTVRETAAREAEHRRMEWRPTKGTTRKASSKFHKLAEAHQREAGALAEKHARTEAKAKAALEAQIHRGIDHYAPPPSADPLWVTLCRVRKHSGLGAFDTTSVAEIKGMKWSTSHERKGHADAQFDLAAAGERADLHCINWRTDGFRAVATTADCPTTIHLDSVGGAVTLQLGWTAAADMTGLLVASALGVPCGRVRLVSLASDEGRDLRKKVVAVRHALGDTLDQHVFVQVKTFVAGCPLGVVGTKLDVGLETCRDIGRAIAADVLLGFDGRFGLFAGGTADPGSSKVNRDTHRFVILKTALVPPEGTEARATYNELCAKTTELPQPECFDGFGPDADVEHPEPEPDAAAAAEAFQVATPKREPPPHVAKAFQLFGAPMGSMKSASKATLATAASTEAKMTAPSTPPSSPPFRAVVAAMIDAVLDQYAAQGTLLGEQPQSKAELSQFRTVRLLIAKWTGCDVGVVGSLAMQDAFIEALFHLGEAMNEDGDEGSLVGLDAELESWTTELIKRGAPDAELLADAIAGLREAMTATRRQLRSWRAKAGL
mmetsp:Transcript_35875/g.94008  ORF Transcript_35875/g.94008 Transcript_35875/m.94008 type:complete len:736 (+) Transcript_35875:144-2351(+)